MWHPFQKAVGPPYSFVISHICMKNSFKDQKLFRHNYLQVVFLKSSLPVVSHLIQRRVCSFCNWVSLTFSLKPILGFCILKRLYKLTKCQPYFPTNITAYVDFLPHLLCLHCLVPLRVPASFSVRDPIFLCCCHHCTLASPSSWSSNANARVIYSILWSSRSTKAHKEEMPTTDPKVSACTDD